MAYGDARVEKWRGNWRMEWVTSMRHMTAEHRLARAVQTLLADVHSSPASSRVNWFPRRFKWTRPLRRKAKSGFCACAITFQTQSTLFWNCWMMSMLLCFLIPHSCMPYVNICLYSISLLCIDRAELVPMSQYILLFVFTQLIGITTWWRRYVRVGLIGIRQRDLVVNMAVHSIHGMSFCGFRIFTWAYRL